MYLAPKILKQELPEVNRRRVHPDTSKRVKDFGPLLVPQAQ